MNHKNKLFYYDKHTAKCTRLKWVRCIKRYVHEASTLTFKTHFDIQTCHLIYFTFEIYIDK